jgi:hypothetical protein
MEIIRNSKGAQYANKKYSQPSKDARERHAG